MSATDGEIPPQVRVQDSSPSRSDFRNEVLEGLGRPQKEISSKFLYDERGSELFERICTVDEYYPTRTELAILKRYGAEMAESLGPGCMVIEPGSGAGEKIRTLLSRLTDPVAFVPVEISKEFLERSSQELARDFPDVRVLPVCADFLTSFPLPSCEGTARRVVFFPGSTIGNFARELQRDLLRRLGELCGPDGAILIGVDLKKEVDVIEAAYDDQEGVTAEFSLNLLRRINRELDGDFEPEKFRHLAYWNEERGCVEIHIQSLDRQRVTVSGETFDFRLGETIRTEYSYKYSPDEFAQLAGEADLRVERIWTDPDRLFSVQLLTPASPRRAAPGA